MVGLVIGYDDIWFDVRANVGLDFDTRLSISHPCWDIEICIVDDGGIMFAMDIVIHINVVGGEDIVVDWIYISNRYGVDMISIVEVIMNHDIGIDDVIGIHSFDIDIGGMCLNVDVCESVGVIKSDGVIRIVGDVVDIDIVFTLSLIDHRKDGFPNRFKIDEIRYLFHNR